MAKKRSPKNSKSNRANDAAEQLRLWVWYQSTRNVANEADDYLDRYLYDEVGRTLRGDIDRRRKNFLRIRSFGYRPRPPNSRAAPDWFVEKIAQQRIYDDDGNEAASYAGTEAVWGHFLWKMVSVKGVSHPELQTFINRYAAQNEIYRFSDRETAVASGRRDASVWLPYHYSGITQAYRTGIEKVIRKAGLDEITFLLALFVEAANYQLYAHAIYLRTAAARALFSYAYNAGFNVCLARLMVETIGLRVISRGCVPPERIALPPKWSPYADPDDAGETVLKRYFDKSDRRTRATRPWIPDSEELEVYRKKLRKTPLKLEIRARELKRRVDHFEYSELVNYASSLKDGYDLAGVFETDIWPI
jgi:hypothetical protein